MTRLNVKARRKVYERIKMGPREGQCSMEHEEFSREVTQ